MWPLTCELTCAVRVSFTGGVDGLLADFTFRLEPAVFTARTVPVAKHRERTTHVIMWSSSVTGVLLQQLSVSDLHWAPARRRQSVVQQRSELMCSSPGSHSSPCSTRELPHTLMFLCLKQDGAFDLRRITMERLLQLENIWTHRTQFIHH